MMKHQWNRREAITGLASSLALFAERASKAAASEISFRSLGRTGQKVSCLGLGGSHIGKPSLNEQKAIRLIRQALNRGLNFMGIGRTPS
jgi:hypothetical protein